MPAAQGRARTAGPGRARWSPRAATRRSARGRGDRSGGAASASAFEAVDAAVDFTTSVQRLVEYRPDHRIAQRSLRRAVKVNLDSEAVLGFVIVVTLGGSHDRRPTASVCHDFHDGEGLRSASAGTAEREELLARARVVAD